MKLSFNQIKEVITGATRIEEENGIVELYRFTKEQEELYKLANSDFYKKTFTTAGIKLSFKTDSKNLFLKFIAANRNARGYFSVDIFVDGKCVGFVDNFSDAEFSQSELPLGEFFGNFQLGDGIKTVCVHLPWSIKTSIEEIVIEDGAFIEAVKPKNKLLVYGDSITHGYEARRPSNRYIAKIADALCAEEFNKAIGGEIFFPELAKLKDSFVPNYIIVAYGTNDWNRVDECTFKKNCGAFFENISRNYPKSKIFAITPIWRKDMNEERIFGDFKNVEADIRQSVKELENVTVISGFDFIPKDEKFYADKIIHPNDEGFEYYFESLYDKIKSEI